MKRKRFTVEQILRKLREAEVDRLRVDKRESNGSSSAGRSHRAVARRLQNVSMTGVDWGGREWTAVDDGNRTNNLFQKQ